MMHTLRPSKRSLIVMTFAGAIVSAALMHAVAQLPPAPSHASSAPAAQKNPAVHLETRVGSFKILGVADMPATGTVDMTFTGTVLVSGNEKDLHATPGPGVSLEYERKEYGKRVYFGTGRLVVKGNIHGLQFFGRDLKATWVGSGVARIYGEFDQDLNTGTYWYDGDTEKQPWGTGGMLVVNPRPDTSPSTLPKVKVEKSGG